MQHPTPKKPKQSQAPMSLLLEHYNGRVDRYNEYVHDFCGQRNLDPADRLMAPHTEKSIERADLIKLIRKQHVKLGDTIKARAIELLLQKKFDGDDVVMTEDGRLVGLSYQEVLDVLKVEHPYASTTAACLRWYIVHTQDEVEDDGEPMYEFPEYRPRSAVRKKT